MPSPATTCSRSAALRWSQNAHPTGHERRPDRLGTSLNHAFEAAYLGPWNAIGQPAATVLVGLDDYGVPIAVQFAGPVDGTRPWATLRPTSGERVGAVKDPEACGNDPIAQRIVNR